MKIVSVELVDGLPHIGKNMGSLQIGNFHYTIRPVRIPAKIMPNIKHSMSKGSKQCVIPKGILQFTNTCSIPNCKISPGEVRSHLPVEVKQFATQYFGLLIVVYGTRKSLPSSCAEGPFFLCAKSSKEQ